MEFLVSLMQDPEKSGGLTLVDDALVGKGLAKLLRIVAMPTSMINSTPTKSVETRQR